MTLNVYRIGRYEIVRIAETSCPAVLASSFYPELAPEVLAKDSGWASPDFYEPATGKVVLSTHTWLIKTPRFNVLFELAAGNDKHRPNFPRAHQLKTDWLARFHETGLSVTDIDYLIPSHLHVDHVGWFTSLVDGRWKPTFPNAMALVSRVEMENWTPGLRPGPFPAFNEGVIEDSVFPLRDEGKLRLIEYGYEIDDGLVFEAMPGHTRGHAGLRLLSEGEGAIFCGDTMYSPLQLVHPELNAYADEDRAANRKTRASVLSACADQGLMLFPSHYPEPYAGVRVNRAGESFTFENV